MLHTLQKRHVKHVSGINDDFAKLLNLIIAVRQQYCSTFLLQLLQYFFLRKFQQIIQKIEPVHTASPAKKDSSTVISSTSTTTSASSTLFLTISTAAFHLVCSSCNSDGRSGVFTKAFLLLFAGDSTYT